MKKLNKQQLQQHANLSAELHDAWEKLDAGVQAFNETVAEAFAKLGALVDEFNAAASNANHFVEDVHAEQEGYHGDKSEKWQEGETGTAYADWMTDWELTIEDVELDTPSELGTPDVDIDKFDQLETECPS